MKLFALIAPLAVALIAAPLGVAQAQPVQTKKQTIVQKHKRGAGPSKIACTVAGCQTIPAHCHPKPGMSWDGMPTGFDIIVCR